MRRTLAAPILLAVTLAACASSNQPVVESASRTSTSPSRAPSSPSPTPPPAPATGQDPFAEAMVEAHDAVRAHVSPPAEPALPPVRWDPELAATAEAWAARCEFEHSAGDLGENLAARTARTAPEAIVASWAAEAEHYDHRRNRCEPGAVCGHYTQIVWRDSTRIGCGVAACRGGGPFGTAGSHEPEWFMWVCNYAAPGNVRGRRPY